MPKRLPSSRPRRSVLLVQSWWEERVFRGVAAYAAKHDWELQCRMRWTHELPDREEWRGDGIIAYAGVSPRLRRLGRRLTKFVRAAGVPVVATQELGDHFGAPQVIVPHREVARLGAEHFLGLNYRHLGYTTFDENAMEAARRAAFQQAVEAAGAEFHALTPKSLARLLPELPRPMALLAVNDLNALEVIRLCREGGAAVPEEFAVMGIDDTEIICDFAAVPLSSINCNYEEQGYEAAALLDRLMAGKPAPSSPVVVHPKGVTVRRSTDTVAIPDQAAARLLRALRDQFRQPLTIQQLVHTLKIPSRQAQDHFRTHVGRTPGAELARLRSEHAMRLLPDRSLKLERIARESGFSNRYHFAATFKRMTGHTPRAYRQSLMAAGEVSAASVTTNPHGSLRSDK